MSGMGFLSMEVYNSAAKRGNVACALKVVAAFNSSTLIPRNCAITSAMRGI